ncbi:MAG: SDR family NAD(P)-dependent oxidoreductase [Pseudomonadota bacterium]
MTEARLLQDRVAIVTGAGSRRGLGRATARIFAQHGAKLVLGDIDADAAGDTADALAGAMAGAVAHREGAAPLALGCDVTQAEQCAGLAAAALDRFGRIDVLVNIAGITSPQRVGEIDIATYERVMDISMRGTLLMTQAVLPQMRRQRSGSIVNMSSVSAQRGGGVFGGAHYAAAKAAVLGFTKACAREVAPEGIRVNALCPGFIDTDITAGMMTPDRRAAVEAAIPMGRAGKAEEVAGCCLFLASDLSSYCTGSEIDPNGGSHIH